MASMPNSQARHDDLIGETGRAFLTAQAFTHDASVLNAAAGFFVMPDETAALQGEEMPEWLSHAQTGLVEKDLPVVLAIHEPRFARQLPGIVAKALQQLGIEKLWGIAIRPDNAADFKSGRLLQTLLEYRQQGVIQHVGIFHEDVRTVEWAVENAGPHFIAFPFSVEMQDARYRLIGKAQEFQVGMFAFTPAGEEGAESIGFLLGARDELGITPICGSSQDLQITSLSHEQLNSHWQAYQKTHQPPDELERAKPPE